MDLSKRTAERMLQNINMKLEALATEQQSMNGNKGGQKMRKGGRVKMETLGNVPWETPKLNWKPNLVPGGYTQRPGSWMNDIQGFGNDKYNVDFGLKQLQMPNLSAVPHYTGSNVAVSDTNLAKVAAQATPEPNYGPGGNNGYINEGLSKLKMPTFGQKAPNTLVGASGVNDVQLPGAGKDPFNWNNLMGLAPTIFNTIAGLTSGKPDVLNPNEFQNPYESQAFGMMPSQFRVDDMLNDNRNAYGTYLRNVNQVGNSRGERMANYGAGMNRMNEANTRAWALKNNKENEMATNKAMLRNDQGVRRAGVNLQIRDMNDQNAAASRNRRMSYLGAAASGAQTYGLTQEQMKGQNASQNAYIQALMGLNPNMKSWLDPKNMWSRG